MKKKKLKWDERLMENCLAARKWSHAESNHNYRPAEKLKGRIRYENKIIASCFNQDNPVSVIIEWLFKAEQSREYILKWINSSSTLCSFPVSLPDCGISYYINSEDIPKYKDEWAYIDDSLIHGPVKCDAIFVSLKKTVIRNQIREICVINVFPFNTELSPKYNERTPKL